MKNGREEFLQGADAVALLAGQQTRSRVLVLARNRCVVDLGKLLCASVTKQYNLVMAEGDDLFSLESNCGHGGK